MSSIKWQQMSDPNFTAANAMYTRGSDALVNAAKAVTTGANDFAVAHQKQNTNKLLDLMTSVRDPEAFESAQHQGALTALRQQLGNDYDAEKYRTAYDARLGKLQTDALSKQKYQDNLTEVADRQGLADYQKYILQENEEGAKAAFSNLSPIGQAQAIKTGLELESTGLNMENIRRQWGFTKDKIDLDREIHKDTHGLNVDKYNQDVREFNVKENGAPLGQYSLNPDDGSVQYEGNEGSGTTGGSVPQQGLVMPPEVRQRIFKGESKGDYDTLLSYSNREGGKFSNVKLTNMTVNDAIKFSAPSGAYGQWSKTQTKKGVVATPMGAYQIVGSTLQEAAKAIGLTGNERMTPEIQDRLADYVYQQQGTGAWVGYKGPRLGGGGYKAQANAPKPKPHEKKSQGLTLKPDRDHYVNGQTEKWATQNGGFEEKLKNLPMNVKSPYVSVAAFKKEGHKGDDVWLGILQAPGVHQLSAQQKLNLAASISERVKADDARTGWFERDHNPIKMATKMASSYMTAYTTYNKAIPANKQRAAILKRNNALVDTYEAAQKRSK